MEREQIIKALECCFLSNEHQEEECDRCPFEECPHTICQNLLAYHSLSLIKELTEERKDFEIRALRAEKEATKYKDRYETEKQAREQLSESYDHLEKTKDELLAERSRLTEENERLKNSITFQVVMPDEKMEKIKAESLKRVELDVKECRADTVKKMQERLKAEFNDCCRYVSGNREYFIVGEELVDRIAKEMLEEEK